MHNEKPSFFRDFLLNRSFDQEAAQQLRSGEPGDHVNMWEAPSYFNNRGIEDLARDKMDARLESFSGLGSCACHSRGS